MAKLLERETTKIDKYRDNVHWSSGYGGIGPRSDYRILNIVLVAARDVKHLDFRIDVDDNDSGFAAVVDILLPLWESSSSSSSLSLVEGEDGRTYFVLGHK